MILWPYKTESLLVSLSGNEIIDRIASVTTLRQSNPSKPGVEILFSGITRADHFSVSLLLNRPVTFIPRVHGEFEDAASGSVLFLEYSMFPATRLYLAFWTLFTILAAAVLYLQYHQPWVAALVMLVAVVSLWIARANFLFHVRRTRKLLLEVLSGENL